MSEALEPCPALTRQHNDLPVRLFVNAMPPHLHYIVRRKKEGINGIQAGVYVCAWYHTIPAVVYYYLLQLWDKKKKRDNALFVEDSQTPSMVLRRQHHHATQAKSRRAGKKKKRRPKRGGGYMCAGAGGLYGHMRCVPAGHCRHACPTGHRPCRGHGHGHALMHGRWTSCHTGTAGAGQGWLQLQCGRR